LLRFSKKLFWGIGEFHEKKVFKNQIFYAPKKRLILPKMLFSVELWLVGTVIIFCSILDFVTFKVKNLKVF